MIREWHSLQHVRILAAHPHCRVIKHEVIDVKNIYQSNLARSDPLGNDFGTYKGIYRVYDEQTVADHDVYARPEHAARLSPTNDVPTGE